MGLCFVQIYKKILLQFEHFVFALKWPKDAFCKMLLSPSALNLMITVINCRTGIGLTKKGANFQKKKNEIGVGEQVLKSVPTLK